MSLINRILLFLIISVLAAGCGVSRRTSGPTPEQTARTHALRSVTGYGKARATLMQAYEEWKGTPYRLGGANSHGVDCSSLVRIIFDDYFNIKLPPNTATQLNAGRGVRRKSLKTGDLVFFRTGRRTLHVGIIIEDDEFLHASTSRGVTISRLGKHYWSSRYLTARRVM